MSQERDMAHMTVGGLCALAGFSRQAYYQERRLRSRQAVAEDAVVELVNAQRRIHPRIGARKLRVLIRQDLREMGISIGRDRFFTLLRRRGLLVKRSRRWAKTTDSRHGFVVWPNRIRNIVASMPHQVWVCDLTYIRTEEGFLYLSLVTDAYSRKIVGYCIHDSLESQGCLRALQMALAQLPEGAQPIHHSDRGMQYCCREYIELLQACGCPVSMTEQNHCYENATAERVNGILKGEYGLGETFRDKSQAIAAARQAIAIYNDCRPHTSLHYRTPSSVHASKIEQEAA
jgi:transposase InsO family protein